MAENKTFIPKVYIYLDETGIDSLFSQASERTETEFVQSNERENIGKIEGKIEVGRAIGILDAAINSNIEEKDKKSEKSFFRLTTEGKINFLTNKFDKYVCFSDLAKAAYFSFENKKSVYIWIFQNFNMPQFLNGKGVDDVNLDKTLSFIIGQAYTEHNYDDSYYRKTQYTFFMQASLSKTTRSTSYMSPTGHDAVLFRAYKGKGVPLGVFGLLTSLSKWTFQIKPFAIWLQ